MRAALICVFAATAMAACFSPTYREGIACAPATQECPPGMSCDPRDGRCYRDVPAIECMRNEDCASGRCDLAAGVCLAVRCGDGVVQEGEGCDAGGASPSCDPDCTPVTCGDGVINEAAGEICDTGRDGCCAADCRALAPAASECRASAGLCDPAETCDGVSPVCPPDQLAGAGTECRPGNGMCDPAEVCDGGSPACSRDIRLSDGSACSDCASSLCDSCLGGICIDMCGNGTIDTAVGEQCDTGDDAACPGHCGSDCACAYPPSCLHYLAAVPNLPDGIYTIDPPDSRPPLAVYCDMTTAGGGWTVVEKSPYGDAIGRALYFDVPVNAEQPGAARHRLPRADMATLMQIATDMRIDCRGDDYLLAAAGNLFNGEGGAGGCANWTRVLYKEARFLGNALQNATICTWHVGRSEGCAGAWHIDEHAQSSYCELPNYPWTGTPITPGSGDAFATDPNTVIPNSECHRSGAIRFVMLR